MKRFISPKAFLFSLVAIALSFNGLVLGQSPRPLLQDIQVHKEEPNPPADSPLVRRTGSTSSTADIVSGSAISSRGIRTSIPILAETIIPGISGVLVESLDGKIVVESGSNIPLNPASNVKVATTYAVLKTFGPEYRFPTNVWTDGVFNESTATLHGNLYISGKDPIFSFEHAVFIANELNRMGIRAVQGDLIITDNFAMNHNSSPARSAQGMIATLDALKRPAAANRAWNNYRVHSGRLAQLIEIPNVAFTGSSYVQTLPTNAKLLFTHESAPMREIVKVMMSYSNNFLSERLADMLGGSYAVARIVQQNTGVGPMEFSIQSGSGLGINRVTASAMMKLLRVLRKDLESHKMTLADVMPVAGMDAGTLASRFSTDFSRGSVIGKTGTLARTDNGVSSLAGEINTRNGRFLFVIFNQRGGVAGFRSFQNSYVSLIQGQFGGAAPINYVPVSLDVRLAKNRISYPDSRPRISE